MGQRDIDILTKEEVESIFDELVPGLRLDTMYNAMFMLMYRCGLRLEETIGNPKKPHKGVNLKDIDLDRGTIRVQNGKGDKKAVLGLDEPTKRAIREWLDERGNRPGLLFHSKFDKVLSKSQVAKKLRSLADKAGIEKRVHPHGLRHTLAVELLEEGINPVQIMKILRHTSLKTTMEYLDHIQPQEVVDVMSGRGM